MNSDGRDPARARECAPARQRLERAHLHRSPGRRSAGSASSISFSTPGRAQAPVSISVAALDAPSRGVGKELDRAAALPLGREQARCRPCGSVLRRRRFRRAVAKGDPGAGRDRQARDCRWMIGLGDALDRRRDDLLAPTACARAPLAAGWRIRRRRAARPTPPSSIGVAQAPADRDQQLVAGRMAERVVDRLEPVEVEQGDRDRPFALVRTRGSISASSARRLAEPGQHVGVGQLARQRALDQRAAARPIRRAVFPARRRVRELISRMKVTFCARIELERDEDQRDAASPPSRHGPGRRSRSSPAPAAGRAGYSGTLAALGIGLSA